MKELAPSDQKSAGDKISSANVVGDFALFPMILSSSSTRNIPTISWLNFFPYLPSYE